MERQDSSRVDALPSGVETRRACQKTLVLCVGNELAQDDSVGIRVGRLLGTLPLAGAGITLMFLPEVGLDALEAIDACGHLIVVDAAIAGTTPGTVTVTDGAALLGTTGLPCCHSFGLAQLLQLAAVLRESKAPCGDSASSGALPQVTLVGIEPEQIEGFGLSLSPPVRAAFPRAVAAVLEVAGVATWIPAAMTRAKQEASLPIDLGSRPDCTERPL